MEDKQCRRLIGTARFQDEGLALLSEQYHGWQIDIVTLPSGVVFQCYPPDLDNFLDAGEAFTDYASALKNSCPRFCWIERLPFVRS